ncbi:endoribonuclease LACTB2 [Agrilus planipennis]|uniref:Beta-lactamase-like protein 2 homolog n=1 Tax=Agrilus planipennis TaxID=224129 RepID=A0A1W4XBE1_AGRPL|nr:endoribonuclease LACTB2 [Agrilus planipennis]
MVIDDKTYAANKLNKMACSEYSLKQFRMLNATLTLNGMAAVIPAVSKLSSRVIRILGCNPSPMTLQGTNTYIVGTGKRRILIDTGDANVPQYLNHLQSVLHDEGIDISHILISHWHHDHMGGVKDVLELQEKSGVSLVWKYPGNKEEISNDATKFHYLKDGQEFHVEGATVRIMHTPGHTADHVAFHLLEENAIFSADCILGEGTAVFENLYDYISSLKKLLGVNSSIIYPGHGNIIKNPKQKIQYYIDHRIERENQILDILRHSPCQPFTEMEIVKIIYADTPEKLWQAAAGSVRHHLIKLQKENKVDLINNRWQYAML